MLNARRRPRNNRRHWPVFLATNDKTGHKFCYYRD